MSLPLEKVACAALLGLALCVVARPSPLLADGKTIVLHMTKEVDLPFGEDVTFPDGPGADVTSANCLTCHSADHTLNQPDLSRQEWSKVVGKMINAYKAPISASNARIIVDYLARIKGEPEPGGKRPPRT